MRFSTRRLVSGFDDPETERRFAEQNLNETLPFMRLAVSFGTLLYAAFGLLDYTAFPDDYGKLWLIRYGIVCPILLLVLVFSFTEPFRRVAPVLMPTGVCVAGLGIVAMTAIRDVPGVDNYYAGVIITMIFCATLSGVRFVAASIVCLLLFVAYFVTATLINPLPQAKLVNNMFFLTVTVAFGIFSAFAQDHYVRRGFITAEALRDEKARAETLLDKARAGSRAKSEFLAVMSHELRTPLNAIIGYAQLQIAGMIGYVTPEQLGFLDRILSNAQHLLFLINQMLDISKIEAGRMELTQHPFNVRKCLEAVEKQNRVLTDAKSLAFTISVDDRLPLMMMGDEARVRQILINLVSNAVKFTDQGEVSIKARPCSEGKWQLIVSDTGIGIPPHLHEVIFDEFAQAEAGLQRGGTGLGLSITRKLIHMMNGSIRVDSGLGKGSSFIVTLPLIASVASTSSHEG